MEIARVNQTGEPEKDYFSETIDEQGRLFFN
jgi:hypothetical protein